MKLDREFAIGAFDLLIRGVSSNAKHLIVIAFVSRHVADKSCLTYASSRRSKQAASLLCRPAGNNYFCSPKQSVFKSITATDLAHDGLFWNLIARLMCNCFLQGWIE